MSAFFSIVVHIIFMWYLEALGTVTNFNSKALEENTLQVKRSTYSFGTKQFSVSFFTFWVYLNVDVYHKKACGLDCPRNVLSCFYFFLRFSHTMTQILHYTLNFLEKDYTKMFKNRSIFIF